MKKRTNKSDTKNKVNCKKCENTGICPTCGGYDGRTPWLTSWMRNVMINSVIMKTHQKEVPYGPERHKWGTLLLILNRFRGY